MKELAHTFGNYEPPRIESFEFCAEQGFATSTLNYDENPSMPYGDENEQWF